MAKVYNYDKTDIEYIKEAYKRGLPVKDIEAQLVKQGRTTPAGKPYSTATVCYVANVILGMRRMQKRRYKRRKTAVNVTRVLAPKVNTKQDAHQIICDVLTSNLGKDTQIAIVKLLSGSL